MPQVVELIAQHVADRTQLAGEPVLLAQQARGRIAAAIGKLRKIDGDERQRADVCCEQLGIVVGLEPHGDFATSAERIALGAPQRERDDRSGSIRHVGRRRGLAQQRPPILDDYVVFNEPRHRRAP